ncbi:MAG: MarR family transcriptional regulator [Deltaproteobacteria bacterium]|nr:MarR family transcriptional regulator [Deltaproteobacteria bacterium]
MSTEHIVALIGSVRARAHELISRELERRGHGRLAPSHGAILVLLYKQGPLPMGALAQAIDRRKNTVTSLVGKLEAAGYVRRQPSPEDQRVSLVALTEQGEAFRADFDAVSEKLLRTIWGDMPPSQREALVAGLEQLLANLK